MMLPLLLSVAWASSNFPEALQSDAGMDCLPPCTVCHETNSGGPGTVVQPFGQALMDAGFLGRGDTAALSAALATLEADGTDSDGDGTDDLSELADGSDPNGDAAICGLLLPEYGCLSALRGRASLGLAAAAGLALLLRRRAAG